MDTQEFAKAYKRNAHFYDNEYTPEQRDLLVEPRKWATAFGEILHDYLSGKGPSEPVDFDHMLHQYMHFVVDKLPSLENEALTIGSEEYGRRFLNENNFHWLNFAMLPMWKELFSGRSVNTTAITNSQVWLAFEGTRLAKRRNDQLQDGSFYLKTNFDNKRMSQGVLNEYDNAIILLEISKKYPHTVILPGPTQFESRSSDNDTNGNKNSDFLVIDTMARQARGAQAKESLYDDVYQRYDSRFVTLIDGAIDLGNVHAVRRRALSGETALPSRSGVEPWPGLISLAHMSNLTFKDKPSNMQTPYFINARNDAKRLLGKAKSQKTDAVRIVSDRIREDLYK